MTDADDAIQLHASAVAVGKAGCLILGSSGSGKSTLALEMIALGGVLIADDRVDIFRDGDQLFLSCPRDIAGLIEARSVGVLRVPVEQDIPLGAIVDLDQTELRRLPENRTMDLLGLSPSVIFGRERHGLASLLTVLLRNGGVVDPAILTP